MSNSQEHQDGAPSRALIASRYADPERRLSRARELFNRTARHYDGVNRLFSLGSGEWYRRFCLREAGLLPGMLVVDVAVGTGLLARQALALMEDRGTVIGIDVSEAMLEIARRRLAIPLIQGTAEALPLGAATADFVTMGYALRHIADLDTALREALRVLRPGGTVMLLEISPPGHKLARLLAAIYIGGILPLIALLAARDRRARLLMRHHWKTIATHLPPEAVTAAMADAGFHDIACRSEFDLFRCYLARRPPS